MNQIKEAARRIHREILSGEDCPYVTRRGVVWADSLGKMVRALHGKDSEWERAKVIGDDGPTDRRLHPLTVASHINSRAEIAVILPPETSWAVIDIDCHVKGDESLSWEYSSRVRIATSYIARWARIQGAEPVVLTSPGGGYHVWIKMDQRWPGEQLREALKRDVMAFLRAAGVTVPGEGNLPRERQALGIDWYPGNHAIRVPGGRGQVLLDPATLRPFPGTIRGRFQRGKRLQRNIAVNASLIADALERAFPIPTMNRAPDPTRWDGLDPYDLIDENSLEFDRLCDRFENSFLGVGREQSMGRIPVQPPTGLVTESPVNLCREIVRGAAFRELLEAAETYGITVGAGSTEAFSAGAKLGWRARTIGISSPEELSEYVADALANNHLEDEIEAMVHDGALKRWTIQDGIQAMRGLETDPERWAIELSHRGQVMAHALEIGFIEMGAEPIIAENASILIAWTLSTGKSISRHHVHALCGERRVPGTRSRIDASVKRFLRDNGLTRISKRYRPGKNVTWFEPTAAAWMTLTRVRFVASRVIDRDNLLRSIPDEFRPEISAEIATWMIAAVHPRGLFGSLARPGPAGISAERILARITDPIDRTEFAGL